MRIAHLPKKTAPPITPSKPHSQRLEGYIDGHILIAMPNLEDANFSGTVVYICSHSEEGAMGIIVNQPMNEVSFRELLEQLELLPENGLVLGSEHKAEPLVCYGGPVETGRGFVLHSADYKSPNTTEVFESGLCLTATLDILKALALGKGPEKALLALGYAGWNSGQLEQELQDNAWLVARVDQQILFDLPYDERYVSALARLGITGENLTPEAGHA